MPRNSEMSFCCGAGGARMWMEETIGTRINVNRTEEAVATGADQIAVGCPFCRIMLSDGLTLQQSEGKAREEVEVLDVAQMLLASVKRAPKPEAVQTATEPDVAATVGASESPVTSASKADAGVDPATEAEPNAADAANPESVTETKDVGVNAKAAEDGAGEHVPVAETEAAAQRPAIADTDPAPIKEPSTGEGEGTAATPVVDDAPGGSDEAPEVHTEQPADSDAASEDTSSNEDEPKV